MQDEKRNGRRAFLQNVGLVSLSTIGIGSGVVGAKDRSPIQTLPPEYRPGAPGVTVVTPEPGSKRTAAAANIAAVLLVEKDDGNLQQVVVGSGDQALEYGLKVDPRAETYEVTEFQFLNPAEARTSKTESAAGQKHTRSSSDDISTEETVSHGPYTVQITTHDVVECKLNRTKQTLEWAYDLTNNSTYITNRDWTAVWWDPTGCGTNWHYDWAKYVDRYEGSSKCYTECEGQYYCDNYMDDNKRTFSWHRVHNTGYGDGTKDYWATADHWGEGSSNLHTHVRLV